MLVTRLNGVIKSFCSKDSFERALLIDGQWGIGKTYTVLHAFDDLKLNYFYISLFGVESENSLMARLSEKIDSRNIILSNGNMFFSNVVKPKQFNGATIIFDDFERKNISITSSTIYGVFDSLIKLGFKIICIVNSSKITDYNNFANIKEKLFDLIYSVSADAECFGDIIRDIKIESRSTILKDADNNWRTIIRANSFYKELEQTMSKNGHGDYLDKMSLSQEEMFRCLILAINCMINQTYCDPDLSNEPFEKVYYEFDVEAYGKSIANSLYYTFKNNKDNQSLKSRVRVVLSYLLERDSSVIVKEYYSSSRNDSLLNSYPFNKELFLYGDEGRIMYKEEFFKRIKEFNFSERSHVNILNSVLMYTIDKFTKDERETLINKLLELVDTNEWDNAVSYVHSENQKTEELITTFKQEYKEKKNKQIKSKKILAISNSIKNNDYKYLTDYLYENRYKPDEAKIEIVEMFIPFGFALPDFSKELDYEMWTYCHEMARFIANLKEYVEMFVSVLKKQIANSSSEAALEKCNALIKYNFSGVELLNKNLK